MLRTPLLGLLPLGLALGACTPTETERTPPDHVLMILVDTLRADHLGSYGHPRSPSPAMDSVAARGVRFARAYSQCSWTAPSMVSLFTGRYLADPRLDIPADLPTLAESFQSAGWATGAFIMNNIVNGGNVGPGELDQGFHRGFDHFQQMVPYSEDGPILDWLAARVEQPTFTYVHYNSVHDPYEPPEEFLHWRREPDPVSADRRHFYASVQRDLKLTGSLDEQVARIETELGGYVDEVVYTDRRIAALLATLEAHGLTERTAVVITSDHGEGLWTREAMMTGQRAQALARGEQPTLFNVLHPTHGNQVTTELIHVPWLLSAPGLPAGLTVEGPVELVDLFPTLLAVCDLPVPYGLQGVNRLPTIEGRVQEPAFAFSHTRFNSTLITPDGWQVIVPTAVGVCEEGLVPALYNLEQDRRARTNLIVEQPELYKALAARLAERRAIGIRQGQSGDQPEVGAVTMEQLQSLGYVGPDGRGLTVGVNPTPADLARELEQVFADLVSKNAFGCPARLFAARILVARKDELSDDHRARIREHLKVETSAAVHEQLELALK